MDVLEFGRKTRAREAGVVAVRPLVADGRKSAGSAQEMHAWAKHFGYGPGTVGHLEFLEGWRGYVWNAGFNLVSDWPSLLANELEPTRVEERVVVPQTQRVLHILKSWPMFFDDIERGIRTSDIRSMLDRRFRVGDNLLLRRWNPATSKYTGREMTVEVTYIQANKSNPCAISEQALHPDYCVLSIRKISVAVEVAGDPT
jgi:hypothetical protein